jgi:hypothetical protein
MVNAQVYIAMSGLMKNEQQRPGIVPHEHGMMEPG